MSGRAVSVRLLCPAKVNLHLEVLGRRPDGYHELRTVFAAVGLHDELEVERAEPGVLELEVEPLGAAPAGGDNLVLQAGRALLARFPGAGGARMRLVKRIPAAAGLGGGSSDAAAALAGLARLWRLPSGFADLQPLAASLGADVPFFLLGGAAWGVGRGSELTPLPDLPPWWVVVLAGPEPIPTAAVYRALGASGVDERGPSALYQWTVDGGAMPFAACRNDLEPTVVAHWPEVGRRLGALRSTGPSLAMLSGSGGAVFGLFETRAGAEDAAGALMAFRPAVAPVLSRAASSPSAGDEHGDHRGSHQP